MCNNTNFIGINKEATSFLFGLMGPQKYNPGEASFAWYEENKLVSKSYPYINCIESVELDTIQAVLTYVINCKKKFNNISVIKNFTDFLTSIMLIMRYSYPKFYHSGIK